MLLLNHGHSMKIKNKTTQKEYSLNGSVNYVEDEVTYFAVSYVNEDVETCTERFVQGEESNEEYTLIN